MAEERRIRRIRAGDAARFSAWERAERPYPWTAAHFADVVASRVLHGLVLEWGGEPVGFAVFQVLGDEAYLLNIMVAAGRRRRGDGKHVLEAVSAHAAAEGAKGVVLEVDPANSGAVALYEASGFARVGRRPHAYPGGEPALVMHRILIAVRSSS